MSGREHYMGSQAHGLGRTNSAIGGTGKVPHPQKPRTRPPTSLRDKLTLHLPTYSGPYSVGSMDIEVPVESPRTFSNITRDGRHLLQLETVLFTLYYPAATGTGSGRDPGGNRAWSRETWLPRPRIQLAKGYGKFAGIPESVAVYFFGATTMFAKLRGFRNAPPAVHWPPEGNSKRRGYKIKNQIGPPPKGDAKEPCFPLLIFSHGLGGTRTTYSTMCGEFASYGFVVCAIEHRDGSGPRTFVNHARRVEGAENPQTWGKVDHSEEEERQGYHKVDYIFPKGNPFDTSPSNEIGVDSELRSAQIELRLAEIEEAYRVLREISEGRGEGIARQNRREAGFVGGSSRGLKGVDWANWKHRFHTDRFTVAGHSFGAATVVEILRNADRFENVQAGIIYDIWGAPIEPPTEDERYQIHSPILGINSEAFMYWQRNFDAVISLMDEARERGAPAFLCTVRGSVHMSQSDFSVLYKHACSFLLKATVHPQRAIDLNISASLEFLRDVITLEGAGKPIIERCLSDEGLLQVKALDKVPNDQKPDDQHIAAKLKVANEFKTRLAASVQRKMKRGVHGFYQSGEEMWMHCKPDEELMRQWQRGGKGLVRGVDGSEEENEAVLQSGNFEQEKRCGRSSCADSKHV
ncbi:hypothetical protein K504DRAFT_488000 [Pleomassaria siparia CBS 279.74]|uniref:1-alkyl-2-acetylglycerophosphocholine esterase n=1 Tax=Pleomassaria siparia CBS 279.74 TaxID=1314801 RepID=A0A6G1KLC6_9PLEO|nr:hypothetical protein K504DRAFT_488000 [Pleomassaria siparia CBS 279.74]